MEDDASYDDEELQQAIALSMQAEKSTKAEESYEDMELQQAISLSMKPDQPTRSAMDRVKLLKDQARKFCKDFNHSATRDELQSAVLLYEEIRSLGQSMEDLEAAKAVESAAQGGLGYIFSQLGEMEKAVSHYAGAVTLCRDLGDEQSTASELGNLGNAYRNMGNYARAVELLTEAIAMGSQLGASNIERNGLLNLSSAYSSLKEPAKSLEALLRRVAMGDIQGGITHHLHSEFAGADVSLVDLKAKPELNGQHGVISGFLPDKGRVGVTLPDKGSVSVKPTNLCFLNYSTRSKTLTAHSRTRALGERGQQHLSRGEYEMALKCFDTSRLEALKAADPEMEANSWDALSKTYASLTRWEEALEAARRAEQLFRALGDRKSVRESQHIIEMIQNRPAGLGQPPWSSSSRPRRSDTTEEQERAEAQLDAGAEQERLGHSERAEALYRQVADAAGDLAVRKAALGSLSSLYSKRRDFSRAISILGEVVQICQALGHEKSESLAYNNLGQAHVRLCLDP